MIDGTSALTKNLLMPSTFFEETKLHARIAVLSLDLLWSNHKHMYNQTVTTIILLVYSVYQLDQARYNCTAEAIDNVAVVVFSSASSSYIYIHMHNLHYYHDKHE